MQNHDRELQQEVEEAAAPWSLQETSAGQEKVKQWLQDNVKSWATPCKEATEKEMRGIKGKTN